MATTLNLLVIRSLDIEQAVIFYQALGLNFSKHRHGKGPEHFAGESDGFVFEIYPLGAGESRAQNIRLGFQVDDLDALVASLREMKVEVVSTPRASEWGRRAVVKDFDGHSVELMEKVAE